MFFVIFFSPPFKSLKWATATPFEIPYSSPSLYHFIISTIPSSILSLLLSCPQHNWQPQHVSCPPSRFRHTNNPSEIRRCFPKATCLRAVFMPLLNSLCSNPFRSVSRRVDVKTLWERFCKYSFNFFEMTTKFWHLRVAMWPGEVSIFVIFVARCRVGCNPLEADAMFIQRILIRFVL